jgi:prephenate dehydratase
VEVAYYGRPGSNTEQAALTYIAGPTMTPCKFLPDVFSAVVSGAKFGVIPAENSTEGMVTQTYDLLFANHRVKIVGEHIIKIEHLLLARPKARISQIKRVYSHPQALAQCRVELEKLRVEQIPFADTAASAEKVSKSRSSAEAAVANGRAADLYGLNVLRSDIANNSLNYTRFFIISAKDNPHWGEHKTSMTFRLPQGVGNLEHALHCFSANKIELHAIFSRPLPNPKQPEDVWKHYFYVELDGSSSDKNVQKAIYLLRTKETIRATDVRVHGSYIKAKTPRY